MRLAFNYERKSFKFKRTPKADEESGDHRFDSMDPISDTGKKRSHLEIPYARKKRHLEMFPTFISYNIELSCDYGKKEKLVGVDVYAAGTSPSISKAIPLDDESCEEFDDKGNFVLKGNKKLQASNKHGIYDLLRDGTDRFDAYIDPECMERFLEWTGLSMDFESLLFVLMSFPYYEHEWDILGFLLDSMFVDENESSSIGSP